jgi:iron complex outermembrane recepter protein
MLGICKAERSIGRSGRRPGESNIMNTRKILSWGAAAAALAAGVGFGPASQAQAQTPAPAAKPTVDAEVIVTARKKAESLQDAPVAVSAFTENAIKDLGIRDISDVAALTPGLVFQQAFGRTGDRPVIRGQSNVLANVQFGVESGTAYFVDGVYYPGSLQSLDFGQIQQVEVIKGPQSALYGRNTYAGAINFIMKSPGDKFFANGLVRGAQHGEQEVNIAVGGPILGDKLSGALYGRYYNYDGEFVNQVTDELVGSEKSKTLSGVLQAKFHKDWDLRLRASINRDQDGPFAIFLQDASANNCMPGTRSLANWRVNGAPVSTNNNQYYCGVVKPGQVALNTGPAKRLVTIPGVPVPPFSGANVSSPANPYSLADGTPFDGVDRNTLTGSVISNWDMGGSGYVLSLSHGFRFEKYKFGIDSDHSPINWFTSGAAANPFLANMSKNSTRDFSSELKIASPTDGKLSWLAGVFHYVQFDRQNSINFNGTSPLSNKLYTQNAAIYGLDGI